MELPEDPLGTEICYPCVLGVYQNEAPRQRRKIGDKHYRAQQAVPAGPMRFVVEILIGMNDVPFQFFVFQRGMRENRV